MKVGILGATGYVGEQLIWLLKQHPIAKMSFIAARSESGKLLSEVYPNFIGEIDTFISIEEAIEQFSNIDVLFLALPHASGEKYVKLAIEKNVRVIDLSADFRLSDIAEYEKWYSVKKEYPELQEIATYGLPELFREKMYDAPIIALAGCYPTSILLGVAPLLNNKMAVANRIIADSKSGVSGAGKSLQLSNIYSEVNENFKAYGVLTHRHTAEINEMIHTLDYNQQSLTFTPHLVPMTRGILSTIYVPLNENIKMNQELLTALYKNFYQNEAFIHIVDALPETKHVRHTNKAHIAVRYDDKTHMVIVISVIDNLIKGAAGQAIQSLNFIYDLPETIGLEQISAYL